MKIGHLVAKILNVGQQPLTLTCRSYLFSVIDPQQYVLEQSVLLVSRQEAKPIAILLVSYLYVHESESESHSVVSDSLRLHGLYSSWNSPGQNTGVGSLSLLQGLFPTQGSNPGLPHCRWILD